MSVKIGLDTTFVLALIDEHDLWHTRAVTLKQVIDTSPHNTLVFDWVLAETVSTLARRTHEKRRTANLTALLTQLRLRFPTTAITWLYPDVQAQYETIMALVETSGGELNFNDALIVVACRQRGIDYLASFDTDFDRVEGLKRLAIPADLPA